jgi:hypothetical protein
MQKSRTSIAWVGALAAAVALGAPASAWAGAADLYYERAVMTGLDAKCRLFSPDLAAALASAEAQARSAALRSGASATDLYGVAARAASRAGAAPCNSPDVATAAGRVRAAFAGYARLQRMNFPGDMSSWTADRAVSRSQMRWNLWQTAMLGPDRLTLGFAGRGGDIALVAVAGLSDGREPYAARLVMRDPALAPEPFLNFVRASFGRSALADRLPPRSATASVLAEARAPADASLLTPGEAAGVAFRFPAAAADRLAALDPRESVAVELVFADASGRDVVRTAYVEVGDFAAGRAFLSVAQR